jgi:hypothetical protein
MNPIALIIIIIDTVTIIVAGTIVSILDFIAIAIAVVNNIIKEAVIVVIIECIIISVIFIAQRDFLSTVTTSTGYRVEINIAVDC